MNKDLRGWNISKKIWTILVALSVTLFVLLMLLFSLGTTGLTVGMFGSFLLYLIIGKINIQTKSKLKWLNRIIEVLEKDWPLPTLLSLGVSGMCIFMVYEEAYGNIPVAAHFIIGLIGGILFTAGTLLLFR